MVEKMKNHRKGLIAGCAVLLTLVIIMTTVFQFYVPVIIKEQVKQVTTHSIGEYEGDKMYLPGETPRFRSNAKFKILEVVPYRGMAEIGYGISGEEPVDIANITNQEFRDKLVQTIHVEPTQNHDTDVLTWDNTKNCLVNQNIFVKTTLKHALKLSDSEVNSYIENHSVDVLVVEADELNNNPKLIDEADYIYLHNNYYANSGNSYFDNLIYLYETHSLEAEKYKAEHGTVKYTYYNKGNYPIFGKTTTDLSMEIIKKLFYYGMIDKMPLTMSGYAVKNEAPNESNIQKLGYAVAVSEFLEQLFNYNSPSSSLYRSYQFRKAVEDSYHDLFVAAYGDSWNDWFYNGMLKNLTNASGTDLDNLVADYHNFYSSAVDNNFIGSYINTTVCTLAHGGGNESSLLSKLGMLSDKYGDIIDETDDEDWCKQVGNNTRDIAVTIMNSARPNFNLLEIEPDNKFSIDALTVKAWLPDSVKVRVTVTQMTMSEFVGIVNDLNSDYDMIYFGKNVNRMLGNKLYYTGVLGTSATLAGYQGENVIGSDFYYSGNDISQRMIDKVKAFMNAGFPVAYDPTLIDTEKVNVDTKMYQFLDEMHDEMYQVTDDTNITGGSTDGYIDVEDIERGKPQIFETSSSGIEEYSEGTTSAIGTGGLNNLEINLRYGTGSYNVYLYVDTDHNGIYNVWKDDGGTYSLDSNYEKPIWQGSIEAGHTVQVSGSQIPDSAMLGTVSWKLEVVKLNSSGALTGIRTNKTGNIKCNASVETVNVLQLSDFDTYPDMKLSSDTDEAKAFQHYANSSIVTNSFRIKVTSLDIFETDSSDLNLLSYDVILIGFVNPNKKLADVGGLLNKLNVAANKGKGIIFTQDALSYFNDNSDGTHWGSNMNYKVRTLLGMDRFKSYATGASTAEASEMTFTYNLLNHFSENKYFSGLEDTIPVTDYVDRVNDAKVTRYPYIINMQATGFSTSSGIYQVDVDQEGAEVQNGVAYFCLSDRNSELNYSVSPKDVRNNYYLWRYNSVFYSGITTDSFESSGGSIENPTEIQLFINTIISAYGLERSINIDVTNLDQIADYKDGKAYMLYADVDWALDNAAMSGSQDIKFYLKSKRLNHPVIHISFYQADTEGKKTSGPLSLYRSGDKFSTTGSGGTDTSFTVNTGTDYTFVYPYEFLIGGANENIIIEATAEEDGKIVTDSVLIKALRRSMFDLD